MNTTGFCKNQFHHYWHVSIPENSVPFCVNSILGHCHNILITTGSPLSLCYQAVRGKLWHHYLSMGVSNSKALQLYTFCQTKKKPTILQPKKKKTIFYLYQYLFHIFLGLVSYCIIIYCCEQWKGFYVNDLHYSHTVAFNSILSFVYCIEWKLYCRASNLPLGHFVLKNLVQHPLVYQEFLQLGSWITWQALYTIIIPNWRPINYSFVCMLISPVNLVNMYKKTKEFWSENEAKRATN